MTAATPAHAGNVLVIYSTGLGGVQQRAVAGQPSPEGPVASVLDGVRVSLGESSGESQVNVLQVPSSVAGGSVPLVIAQNGVSSSPVSVAVQ